MASRWESRGDLQQKFSRYDKSGDRTLDFEELCKLLKKGNPSMNTAHMKVLFDSMDKNSTGRIDFDEFVNFICSGPTSGPQVQDKSQAWHALRGRIGDCYGESKCAATMELLRDVVAEHADLCRTSGMSLGGGANYGPRDACIITYANTFTDGAGGVTRPSGKMPIRCLGDFLTKYEITKTHKCMHLLPMFPWDTDRGFSVKDYYKVEPKYGDWDDIIYLASEACGAPQLMFDFVCNHASIDNPMVQNALIQRHLPESHPKYAEVQRYKDFVVAYGEDDGPEDQRKPPQEQLLKLSRPRAHPPLTHYFVIEDKNTKECRAILGTPDADAPPDCGRVLGSGWVWTTFSRGRNAAGKEGSRQVDLNYRNPKVVAEVARILLFYVRQKSTMIRLDAIGYIWKVLGSASIHERGTHMMLAILYGVLQIAAPGVVTIAEVNEPQSKCFEYLGRPGHPEGDQVYNFSGFSLALHAQVTNDVHHFSKWLGSMDVAQGKQFLTVLGSHDGLAQKQARELLPPDELDKLHHCLIQERGGYANYAFAPGGKKIVYEICGTPWCIVNGSKPNPEPLQVQVGRYLNSMSMSLLARGMPGVYINGLIGASNYIPEGGVDEYRTMNREVFDVNKLFPMLDDPNSKEGAVMRAIQAVMAVRMDLPQFDRAGPTPRVLQSGDPAVLAVILDAPSSAQVAPLLAIMNVSNQSRKASVRGLPSSLAGCVLSDALEGAGARCRAPGKIEVETRSNAGMGADLDAELTFDLQPYDVLWFVRKVAMAPVAVLPTSTTGWDAMRARIAFCYGDAKIDSTIQLLQSVIKEHVDTCNATGTSISGGASYGPRDACIITYANTFVDGKDGKTRSGGKMPIRCLCDFLQKYGVTKTHRCMHMLPMFPWDTDRGFSVKNYYIVDPRYGTWDDVDYLASEACGAPQLMFDFVCNHASIDNPLVQAALMQRHLPEGHPQFQEVQKYKDFCTAYCEDDGPVDQQRPPQEQLLKLTRPRANPPLTPYFIAEDADGKAFAMLGSPQADAAPSASKVLGRGYVWTTFSRGKNKQGEEGTRQVDLNYKNPLVVAEVLRILLFYVRHNSRMIRLDAIGYIWKVLGSASIHERGTHMMLAIIYGCLQIAAPGVVTIAEVNEPQNKCFDYLGQEGHPEGDQVYNFSGFSMALHAQVVNNVDHFSQWLGSMDVAKGQQFLTVLGSHDGLAQKQARDLLPSDELDKLHHALIQERGGYANYAYASGGKKIVYEICGTPWSIVNGSKDIGETLPIQLGRYLNAMCMGLLARGMPGVYINGLLGVSNYIPPNIDEYRTMNREVFDISSVYAMLDDPSSKEGKVMKSIQDIMKVRSELPQFDREGAAPRSISGGDPAILAVILDAPRSYGVPPLLALMNVSKEPKSASVRGLPPALAGSTLIDALKGTGAPARDGKKSPAVEVQTGSNAGITGGANMELSLPLSPFETLWLVKK